ncbi:hypothetical protein QBC44DRAFT_392776 [Cladorrhinum sp. PSN332]|nr:hypothetical protein QBC44DRAFT_392776 [Cladorrhinum sp. PSN332]
MKGSSDSPHLSRSAFGRVGRLGMLYNARDETLYSNKSILSEDPPAGAVQVTDAPAIKYEFTSSDTLQEKFAKLDISGDVSASLLGGLFKLSGSGKYLSTHKTSARVQCASAICNIRTIHERLYLGSDLLKSESVLDLDALTDRNATHVITGIQWGGSAVVTVEESAESTEDHVNGAAGAGIAGFIVKALAEAKGKGEWDEITNDQASSFRFTINADISVSDVLPVDFSSVAEFMHTLPKELGKSNSGKGVPVQYDLTPIAEIAERFDIAVRQKFFDATLSSECLARFVDLFQRVGEVNQRLNDSQRDAEDHKNCVPPALIEKVEQRVKEARKVERRLKQRFQDALVDIRSGESEIKDLWGLLEAYDHEGSDLRKLELDDPISTENREKMRMADGLLKKGVRYMTDSPRELDNVVTRDLFVLYFNTATMAHSAWRDTISLLHQLIEDKRSSYDVVVVDCDMVHHPVKARTLDKPLIQRLRDGKVITADVLAEAQELTNKALVRCEDPASMQTSRSIIQPAGSRVLKMCCPGCVGHKKLTFTCPTCRDVMWEIPFSRAEFRCGDLAHGNRYSKSGSLDELEGLLHELELSEEHNILILGETGVGKSTFINAFYNYLLFESLDDAMAAECPLDYLMPAYFSYQERDEERKDIVEHAVSVGEESSLERKSLAGQSATQECVTYVFRLGGEKIRLIDTPGIGDTRGLAQDQKNVRNVLSTLESVDKLDAILFLLKPNTPRLTKAFDFCMTELLSRLHRDTTANILFGFTNSRASNFSLGDTKVPLNNLLEQRRTNITLGYANTFFFDAEGFRFLALYKKQGRQMVDKACYDDSWTRSAAEAHRLLEQTRKLAPHNVQRTLKMNRTREFLTSMTQPMVATGRAAAQTKEGWQKQIDELSRITSGATDLEKKLMIMQTVPVRKDLAHPKTVCSDDSCSTVAADKDTGAPLKIYHQDCHADCTCVLKVPNEVMGDPGLSWCHAFFNPGNNAFTNFFCEFAYKFQAGNKCKVCGHDWKIHFRVSYSVALKQRQIKDPVVADQLQTEKGREELIQKTIKELEASWQEIDREQKLVKEALARFGVYLKDNALVPYNDATIGYLDYLIHNEERNQNSTEIQQLRDERKAYEEQLNEVKQAIATGESSVPSDDDIETILDELYSMKHYKLEDVMPRYAEAFGRPQVVDPVEVPLKSRSTWMARVAKWLP